MYGDCLWIECEFEGGRVWRLLIDGGPPDAWPKLKARIEALDRGKRTFDVVVVSHLDSDHIGGLLPLFEDVSLGVTIGDVWFNGSPQLPDFAGNLRSVDQAESLVALLGSPRGKRLPWNVAFGGLAATTGEDGGIRNVEVPDGPQITLLSPTSKRLAALRATWQTALTSVRQVESDDSQPLPPLLPLVDLVALAQERTPVDVSAPNGSSIAFLLEHAGRSCLLAADAVPSVLGGALTTIVNRRGVQSIELDAFKLPHHCSNGNVTLKMLNLAPARHYLVSTDGTRFHHPHDIAMARAITATGEPPTLWFNYSSTATRKWADPSLQARHRYRTRYPKQSGAGITVEFDS